MKALLWCNKCNRPTLHVFEDVSVVGKVGKLWYACWEKNGETFCGERRVWGNEYLPSASDVDAARLQGGI